MIKLNLEPSNEEETIIKQYLEEHVSEVLADKINNGVQIEKDNKQLINRKDLSGFMNFALKEAKNLASKNAIGACILDSTVYGWAIHYFEEDSIEGNLFNLDGSEYKAEPTIKPTEKPKAEKTIIKQNPQQNMFDLILNNEEIKVEEQKQIKINENLMVDQNTGLVEPTKELNKSYDEQTTIILCSIFGDQMEIQ